MSNQRQSLRRLPGKIAAGFRRSVDLARRCLGNRRGATAVWFATMVVPLLGAVGVAVDTSRAYYTERDLQCDCWFRLGDIRRLVLDDTVAVIAELRKLRNTHYEDQPVSLYGGMVNLPLVVSRDDGSPFFDPELRDRLLEGKYWAEADAARTGLGAVERDLRENLFGADAWNALDLTTRTFIATAEQVFRTHRADAGFDFTAVVVDLAKALEVQANLVVRQGLDGAPEERRRANIDGTTRDIANGPSLSLGQLGRVLAEERLVAQTVAGRLRDGDWLVRQGAYVLSDIARHRNPAAHEANEA